jgi:putative toxin-antitoxin system antitoxin component (TIGR02293 family)
MKTTEGTSLVQELYQLNNKMQHPASIKSDDLNTVEEPAVAYESYPWLGIIRKGIPYDALELLGKRANMSIRHILDILDIPQTTYNKKKREHEMLSSRDTELVLAIAEVLDYGTEVFNNEEGKFFRWLKKPNLALGKVAPESLFDTYRGIQEVKNCLERLDYGIMS